jgi:hypothetical protein
VWLPSSSTIRVACHNAPPVQVGSLLFELLNADVRLPRPRRSLGSLIKPLCADGSKRSFEERTDAFLSEPCMDVLVR